MDASTWIRFLLVCILAAISPGGAALGSITCGISYGFRRGWWVVPGLYSGLTLMALIVATGAGAILATSHTAFLCVKWLGVLYLAYLGVLQWRMAGKSSAIHVLGAVPSKKALIWRGFLINASNPKAVIVLLAILPQFMNLSRPLGISIS